LILELKKVEIELLSVKKLDEIIKYLSPLDRPRI